MPPGLTASLREDEFVHLVRFLSELGKPGPWGPRSTATIQRWRVARPLPKELLDDSADAELVRQIREFHAKGFGGSGLVIAGLFHGRSDQLALQVFDRLPENAGFRLEAGSAVIIRITKGEIFQGD
jgi:hypothetical protein